ncbi:MAG: hypothetical protein VKJ04_11620 [Vampirovibrionales bacterium]|nr:hypothetical protein [Vampirovibrionales bacterium]
MTMPSPIPPQAVAKESAWLRFNNFLNSPLGLLLYFALYTGFNIPVANQVSKLDQRLSPQTHQDSILRYILPTWYNAFTISKHAPDKTPQNAWKHTIAKVLFPSTYTALQLSKLKAKADGISQPKVPWVSLLMAPSSYSQQTAKELAEKKPSSSGLNVVSASSPSSTNHTAQPITIASPAQNPPTASATASPVVYNPVRLA